MKNSNLHPLFNEILNSQLSIKKTITVNWEEFYNLMQDYRHAPISDQEKVTMKFLKVKDWVVKSSLLYKKLDI